MIGDEHASWAGTMPKPGRCARFLLSTSRSPRASLPSWSGSRTPQDAQARQIFRDVIDMPATVEVTHTGVVVEFHRRAHLPIVIASGRLNKPVKVPWWNDLPLRLTT